MTNEIKIDFSGDLPEGWDNMFPSDSKPKIILNVNEPEKSKPVTRNAGVFILDTTPKY